MSAATLSRDTFAPQRPPGMRSGLLLALVAHALLIVALAWSVHWKSSEPEGVVAELWSTLPQTAAPRAVPPPPAPPVVEQKPPVAQPTPPVVQSRPEPQTPPRPDPQIAIEREARRKAEAAKREEAKQKAEAERLREQERERQRVAAEQAEKKKLAEKAKQDEARVNAIREANLKRMMKEAGASDDPAATTGSAARTAGPSASYAGRIKARIKPNIVLTGDVSGNPLASVEVRLAPDGTIVGRRILKSSGSPVWDETVLRAIDKTGELPKDTDGRVPSSMTIDFRPQE